MTRGGQDEKWGSAKSTERERERLDAAVEELDLELAVGDRLTLSNELIQTLLGRGAGAMLVDVGPMRFGRQLAVEKNAEGHASAARRRPHDQIDVPRMKATSD